MNSKVHSEKAYLNKLLSTVNEVSKKLLTFQHAGNFGGLVQDCLRLLGESINKNRIYMWKDRTDEAGRICCTQIYEWVCSAQSAQSNTYVRCNEVFYEKLPSFLAAMGEGRCLNSLVCDLVDSERAILVPQGIKTILIAPISVNGKRWGFIGVDNCESEQLFIEIEEHLLFISGSMLANTIEKMEAEVRLCEMEEYTQIMLDSTPLCCNLWTKELYNMRCNEEAVRLFELSSQQEYLERFFELSPKYQPCGRMSNIMASEYIRKAFEEGYVQFEWVHQKLDGTPIPAEITLVRIKYKDNFIVAGYTRDLREQKAMLEELRSKENDLRTARDEALLNSKAKSNFLANMSHEIRTPMNAISGLSEIILRESADKQTMEYAKEIKVAASNLLNIINDILDISKIESGKLEVYNVQYELASMLNDVITVSRVRLDSKALMFITDIDSSLPARLIGDEIRMKQILINLLSNAIKFTQDGYIALRVWGTFEGEKVILHFSVKDSGIGIKQEDLERLFDEFERVNTTKNRNVEGTGLGLAISKQLCQLMYGSIEVNSIYGKGSEFTVVIPQQYTSYEPLSQVEKGKRVLLYEPRERYRNSIAESLEKLGCSCVACANQFELYDDINKMPYDYILTAMLHLKKVQSIAKNNKLSSPIAVFAGFGETLDDSSVYTIQFPVNCLQLADLLNGSYENEIFVKRTASDSGFIAPSAHVLVVDDNPVNLRVAEGLMSPYCFTIDTAANGLEAVEMVKSNQYDLVFMDHMMPGMDGIDATAAIRRMDGTYYKNIPIIALTANALVGTREMFIREGMNDFLAKPIEINKLGYILSKWLPKRKLIKGVQRKPVEGKTKADLEIPGVNTTQGILSVGGSIENYNQILAAYFADGSQKCSSLMNHVLNKDMAAFRTEVHALKSTSATIGAQELSVLAAELESSAQSGDVTFINKNLDPFLTYLKKVLEGISLILADVNLTGEQSRLEKEVSRGNIEYFKSSLDKLYEAAELADISQMEQLIKQLGCYDWSGELAKGLLSIQESLAAFDYDSVLECVTRLKKM